ncbi:hypothetical protein [Amphibacillus indicireducens]|uniref:Uncharacterized protein n=1 Tax=Amphibacillus indicireducens TaxID=1076330 RepID=A0ABP7VHB5_9BACI
MYKKLLLFLILLTGVLIGCQTDDESIELDYEGIGTNWRVDLEYEEEQLNNGEYEFEFNLVITYNDQLGESIVADQMGYRLELGDVAVFENMEVYDETIDVSALYVDGEGLSEHSLTNDAQVLIVINWDDQEESFPLNLVRTDDD